MTDPRRKLQDTEEAVDAVIGFAIDIKRALADGRITVDEVVGAFSDGEVKESVRRAMDGIYNIPNELSRLSPWDGIALAQRAMMKLSELFTISTEVRG